MSGRQQKEQGQARTSAEQGMDAIATEQCTRMVRRGMSHLRIGVTPPPGEDGRAIDDQITGADESTAEGNLHGQDEPCLPYRGTSSPLAFPLLRGRGDTRLTEGIERQATSQR